jgi:hypothetical protein
MPPSVASGQFTPNQTNDFYQLVVERHRHASTVITSNREPPEILAMMADPLLAQSAIDRVQSAAFELVLEGEIYRQRQKPTISLPSLRGITTTPTMDDFHSLDHYRHTARDHGPRWSLARGKTVVP